MWYRAEVSILVPDEYDAEGLLDSCLNRGAGIVKYLIHDVNEETD